MGWTTLDELREYALSRGWFLNDFECAITAVGADPRDVANRLQLMEYQGALHGLKIKAAEHKRIEQFEMPVNLNLGEVL